jgi:hypothetical protein
MLKTPISGTRVVTVVLTLFSAGFVPCSSRADTLTLLGTATASIRSSTTLNINGSPTAQAFGINSAGTIVGTVNGNAFALSKWRFRANRRNSS